MTYSKYLPVNWIDGMRINKDHFIASEYSLIDMIQRTAALGINAFNYGLLAPIENDARSLKITTEIDAREILHVRLNTCQAVTRGGIFIDIYHESGDRSNLNIAIPEASLDLSKTGEEQHYLVLTVDPFKRVPAGTADAEENPPRNPYTIPEYKLDLVPVTNVTPKIGNNFLVIGFVKITEKKPHLSESYIPPCAQVRSHPTLIDLHDRIDHFLVTLEKNSLEIINKVHTKRQKSTLSATVLNFNEHLLLALTRHVSEHKWIFIHQPPVFMLESLSRLARLIMNITDSYPDEYREEMINYYSDWCNLKQGEYEEILKKALNLSYIHENIKESIIPLIQFMDKFSLLYNTLIGLEYIGKPRELGVYIKEEIKTKRPLFTDD
jgi:hypothetical protein